MVVTNPEVEGEVFQKGYFILEIHRPNLGASFIFQTEEVRVDIIIALILPEVISELKTAGNFILFHVGGYEIAFSSPPFPPRQIFIQD